MRDARGPRRRRWGRWLVGWSLALAAGARADGQSGSPRPPAATSTDAALVTVDFRALGADGQPLVDLKPDEVTLRVGGRTRTLRSLQLLRPSGRAASELPAPFAENAVGEAGRDVFLVLDEDSIAPGREQPVREAVRHLVRALPAEDRVGLTTVPLGRAHVGLTRDHDRVLSTLAGLASRAQVGETTSDLNCRTRLTLEALERVFALVDGELPATVVFFSVGMARPAETFAQLRVASDLCEVRTEHFRQLGAAAVASRATLYVVHVMDERELPGPAAADLAAGLESLAGVAGGEFVRVLGDAGATMGRVAREISVRYLASFEPEAAERDGSSRRVEVRVDRPGARVQVLPEVTIPRPRPPSAATRPPNPREMLRVGRAYRDLPLRAASFTARTPGDDRVKIVTLFEPSAPGTTLTAAAVGLFDKDGKLAAQWTAQGGELGRQPVIAALAANPGTYRVRVAAVDGAGRRGTVDEEVVAEAPRSGPVTLSALLLGIVPDGAFAPKLQFAGEAAAVAYLEVYGASRTAALDVRFELAPSADAAPLLTAPGQSPGPGSTDLRIAYGVFPLAPLPPGDYLVRAVVAVDGRVVGRVERTLRKAG
jgi:hypothetical protein